MYTQFLLILFFRAIFQRDIIISGFFTTALFIYYVFSCVISPLRIKTTAIASVQYVSGY